jgi:hypothetical protein
MLPAGMVRASRVQAPHLISGMTLVYNTGGKLRIATGI